MRRLRAEGSFHQQKNEAMGKDVFSAAGDRAASCASADGGQEKKAEEISVCEG